MLEVDAASNNSVDNIRELRERIAFRPMRGRYRITILDEVHMLSTGAFNALLKTLEEPPAHAKFIFATTAPEKIPDTIRSRCQFFEFRRIDETAIAARLAHVCKLEKFTVPETVLSAIARSARGGMRDSLSLLDQLIAFAGTTPTEDDLARVMGTAGREALSTIAGAVLDGQRAELLKAVGEHAGNGGEPMELLNQLADYFRACLAIALCGPETDLVMETGELRARMTAHAGVAGPDRLEAIVRHLVSARERARFAGPLARVSVECALLAAARSGEVATIPALIERLLNLEKRLASGGFVSAGSAHAAAPAQGAMQNAGVNLNITNSPRDAAPGANAAPPASPAQALLDALAARNSFGKAVRDHAVAVSLDGKILKISLRPLDDRARVIITDNLNKSAAEKFLGEMNPGISLVFEMAGAAAATPATGAPAPPSRPMARPGSGSGSGSSAPVASAPPPPAMLRIAENQLSPASKFVIESTRGRVLGQTPAPRNTPKLPNEES